MSDKHMSAQFDSELHAISTRILEMGGMVESQVRGAVGLISEYSSEVVQLLMENEVLVNTMEVTIDHNLSSIISRRQPTAIDLRLLLSISKTTANLERIGDEAVKIARMVNSIKEKGNLNALPVRELLIACDLASKMLKNVLDAFARLDINDAVAIIKSDDLIDNEFDGFVRKLITYMMEDPKTISPSLDLLFLAKALERVGDHAKNIAESIIFVVKGEDVRHSGYGKLESLLNS